MTQGLSPSSAFREKRCKVTDFFCNRQIFCLKAHFETPLP